MIYLTALTDGGAITDLDAREEGVHITYVPSDGADSVYLPYPFLQAFNFLFQLMFIIA